MQLLELVALESCHQIPLLSDGVAQHFFSRILRSSTDALTCTLPNTISPNLTKNNLVDFCGQELKTKGNQGQGDADTYSDTTRPTTCIVRVRNEIENRLTFRKRISMGCIFIKIEFNYRRSDISVQYSCITFLGLIWPVT